MTQGKRTGMALWLKITIGVVVLGSLSGLGLLIVGGIFVADSARKMMDPKSTAQVAESIARIDDPLPDGFTRVMAVDMMGVTEAAFANQPEGLTIMLMKMQKTKKTPSADFLVDNYVKSGAPDAPGNALRSGVFAKINSPMVIQTRSTMTVGGEEMPYAIGAREMNKIKIFQMIGCVVPARTNRAILVFGQCSHSQSYKMELTKKFLAAIKGF